MVEMFAYMGIGSMYGLSLMLFRLASGHWWCRYGKEALLCAASFLLMAVTVRLLATIGTMTAEVATIINGMMALGFFVILAQLIVIHQRKHIGG